MFRHQNLFKFDVVLFINKDFSFLFSPKNQIPSIFSWEDNVGTNSPSFDVKIFTYPTGTSEVSNTWYSSVVIEMSFH